ncbi:21619_t:CDS:2, partial [Gigaspora margarita]
MNFIFLKVTATSIKVTDLEFDDMSAIGKRIGEKEPTNFWVKVRHKINNTYLTNRTNAINQKIRSTTALLVGTMNYLRPTSNSNEGKHILVLEEILLFSTYVNNKNTNNQEINIPWLFQDRTILSQMGPTTLPSPSSILQTALNSNPIPLSTEQSGQETQDQNNQMD